MTIGTTEGKSETKFDVQASPHIAGWLAEQRISLAFTTYQTGKLFFVGLNDAGRLSVFERNFRRCMGFCADPGAQTLYMSDLYQLWRFENILAEKQLHDGYDKLFVPQLAYTTGDLDIHDVAIGHDGRPVFINTLFNCLATVSETHSFKFLWKPPFISELAPEDRCHLNGLAMENGRPAYVTIVGNSNKANGWRQCRQDGGMVMNIQTNEVIAKGLSMPHSPRLHRDKLWLLESGAGHFGYVDAEKNSFTPLTFCPGYLRGLSFIGDYAVCGLSLPRKNRTFQDLALDAKLEDYGGGRCGLCVIDLNSGEIVHSLYLKGVVEELYDVVVLNGVKRPMALGLKTEEIRRTLNIES